MPQQPSLTPTDRRVLAWLSVAYQNDVFYPFDVIMANENLDRDQVRESCRKLRAMGLAHYMNGLMDEEGRLAGAGYAATEKGYRAHVDTEGVQL